MFLLQQMFCNKTLLQQNFCCNSLMPQTLFNKIFRCNRGLLQQLLLYCNGGQQNFFVVIDVYCNNFKFIATKNFVTIRFCSCSVTCPCNIK